MKLLKLANRDYADGQEWIQKFCKSGLHKKVP